MEHKTFILIHGAWNWHKVTPLLERPGHRAFTLDTAVRKVGDVLAETEARSILVGHSKNGIVISQAAEYYAEKM